MGSGAGSRWRQLFFSVMAGLALSLSCLAVDVNSLPKPTGYVSDLAHVLNDTDKDQLEAFCTKVEGQLGVQFALVTVDTVGDENIRDFALNLFRRWGVGDRKTNQGVLLLLAVKDHKDDIETGRGIEPYLTDGFSGSTLRAMRPQLRANDYGAALQTASREMANQIAQGKNLVFSDDQLPAPQAQSNPQGGISGFVGLLLLGLLLLLWLAGRRRRRRGGNWRGGGTNGVYVFNSGGGFSSSSDWGSGGGFGNDSGGSGGFGGFGGGDAGGGGASSDW